MTRIDVEYVADERDLTAPGIRDIRTEDEAIDAIVNLLRDRLHSVHTQCPGPAVLMLSGGIDSILIAAVVADLGLPDDILAVTYTGADSGGAEVSTARRVADTLGLEHEVIAPDDGAELVRETVRRLGSSDPWEVLAGVTLLAVTRAVDKRFRATPALITGAGADALFLGGVPLDPADPDWAEHWDVLVRDKVARNFTRERFIPDFYERLIDAPQRHIQVWQTHAAYDLAMRIHPDLLRGPERAVDKYLFRQAAVRLGVPAELVSATKNPMQVSSGGVDAIVARAREELAAEHGARTYSDPVTEPLEFTVARLWLGKLLDDLEG